MAHDRELAARIRENLKRFCRDEGVSLADVAATTKISLDLLRKVSSGTRFLQPDALAKIADYFGRRMDDFRDAKPPPPFRPPQIPVFALKVRAKTKIPAEIQEKAQQCIETANREFWALSARKRGDR